MMKRYLGKLYYITVYNQTNVNHGHKFYFRYNFFEQNKSALFMRVRHKNA